MMLVTDATTEADANLGAADFKRVRAIGIGTMGPAGPFRFEIDDVRLE